MSSAPALCTYQVPGTVSIYKQQIGNFFVEFLNHLCHGPQDYFFPSSTCLLLICRNATDFEYRFLIASLLKSLWDLTVLWWNLECVRVLNRLALLWFTLGDSLSLNLELTVEARPTGLPRTHLSVTWVLRAWIKSTPGISTTKPSAAQVQDKMKSSARNQSKETWLCTHFAPYFPFLSHCSSLQGRARTPFLSRP